MGEYCEMPQGEELRILLMGKTGHGKSATGNTILCDDDEGLDDAFVSESASQSVTATVLKVSRAVRGRQITVVDTPGVCDTEVDDKITLREIASAIVKCPEGYHAFIIVIRYGTRLTDEEHKALQHLEELFGKEVFNYTIVVLTHGGTFQAEQRKRKKKGENVLTIEEHVFKDELSDKKSALGPVLKRFKGGVVLFDNIAEDTDKKNAMVHKLVQKIDDLLKENKGRCYDNHLFQCARMEVEKAAANQKTSVVEAKEQPDQWSVIMDAAFKGVYKICKKYSTCTIM